MRLETILTRFIMIAFLIGVVCGSMVGPLANRAVAAADPAKRVSGLYVNYHDGDTIDVFDFGTNKVLRTIKAITGMNGMSVSPDGTRLYVVSHYQDELAAVDLVARKVIKTVSLPGPAHSTTALTKDGKRLFVGIWSSWKDSSGHFPKDKKVWTTPGALEIFDTTTLEKIKTIPMKSGMHDLEMTPDGKYLIAGSQEGGFLTVVDVQAEEPAWDLTFDTGVLTMAIESGPDGSARRLFVNRNGFHGFDVVDFAKRKVVAEIPLPETEKFKARPPGSLDPGSSPAHGIGIAPDKKTLWVNGRLDDAVFEYSVPDLKLLGQADVGKLADWMAFSPDSKTVYVGTPKEPIISAVDAKTLKVVTIPLESIAYRFFAVKR